MTHDLEQGPEQEPERRERHTSRIGDRYSNSISRGRGDLSAIEIWCGLPGSAALFSPTPRCR